MPKGIHREKAPESVKAKILDACAELLAKGQSPTIREVAHIASVTTGAIQHHFGSRQQLLMAFQEQTVAELVESLSNDQEGNESPAQKYVRANFELLRTPTTEQRHKAFLVAAVTEPDVAQAWSDWVDGNRRIERESTQQLVARLAADGLWLAKLFGCYGLSPTEMLEVQNAISHLAKKV